MCEVTSNFAHKDQNLFIIETFVLHIRKEFPRKWGWKLQSYTRTKVMLLSNIAKGEYFIPYQHFFVAMLQTFSSCSIVFTCLQLCIIFALHSMKFNGQSSFDKSIEHLSWLLHLFLWSIFIYEIFHNIWHVEIAMKTNHKVINFYLQNISRIFFAIFQINFLIDLRQPKFMTSSINF